MILIYGGKVAPSGHGAAEKFSVLSGYGVNRFIGEVELLDFYACADLVWCAYGPDYDQPSGILGRAVQLGIPVVVRKAV